MELTKWEFNITVEHSLLTDHISWSDSFKWTNI